MIECFGTHTLSFVHEDGGCSMHTIRQELAEHRSFAAIHSWKDSVSLGTFLLLSNLFHSTRWWWWPRAWKGRRNVIRFMVPFEANSKFLFTLFFACPPSHSNIRAPLPNLNPRRRQKKSVYFRSLGSNQSSCEERVSIRWFPNSNRMDSVSADQSGFRWKQNHFPLIARTIFLSNPHWVCVTGVMLLLLLLETGDHLQSIVAPAAQKMMVD